MPFLNLETGVLLYADTNVENPKIRLADITDMFQQVTISNVKSMETIVEPGESEVVISTQRTLGAGIGTSEFTVSRPIDTEDIARLTYTGTGGAPGFRTLRSVGVDSTTHMAMTRVGPRSMKLMGLSGTAFNTTSILPGDQLWIERNSDAFTNPFSSFNCDKLLTVQSKGTGYVVVNDEGFLGEETDITLGTAYASAFKVFAQPSVSSPKIGDYVQIVSGNFNFYNRGIFKLLRITDAYLEFSNPYAVDETVTNTASGLVIFDYLIRFAHMVSNGELQIAFDGNAEGLQMSPLGVDQAQFTATFKATQVSVTNNTMNSVVLRCQFAGTVEE